jgi:hypothetical protein
MKNILKASMLMLAIYFCYSPIYGQENKDSIKMLKNTIRINITSPMLFGDKYNVIGYERVVGPHQTFSVNMGRFSFPKFVDPNLDSLKLGRNSTDKGFTVAFDYRFYLRKENKNPAPRGVFIGPYYTFNSFDRTNSWIMDTQNGSESLNTNLHLNMNMVGGQLGYQFIIKNRFAIDMIVMGPGIWFYNIRTEVTTSLSAEDQEKVLEKINEMLADKLPGHEILINTGDLQKTGSFTTQTAGFRYLVHLGFRF